MSDCALVNNVHAQSITLGLYTWLNKILFFLYELSYCLTNINIFNKTAFEKIS